MKKIKILYLINTNGYNVYSFFYNLHSLYHEKLEKTGYKEYALLLRNKFTLRYISFGIFYF